MKNKPVATKNIVTVNAGTKPQIHDRDKRQEKCGITVKPTDRIR